MRRTIQLPFLAPFSLTDGVVISSDAICLRKVGHRYLAEVPHSCGSTQDVVGKEIVVGLHRKESGRAHKHLRLLKNSLARILHILDRARKLYKRFSWLH